MNILEYLGKIVKTVGSVLLLNSAMFAAFGLFVYKICVALFLF